MNIIEQLAYSYIGAGAVMAVWWTLLYCIDKNWKINVLEAIVLIPLMAVLAVIWLPIAVVVAVAPRKVIRFMEKR